VGYWRFLRMRSNIVSPQPLPSFRWSPSVRLKQITTPCLLVTGSFIRHIHFFCRKSSQVRAHTTIQKQDWLCHFFLVLAIFSFLLSHSSWPSTVFFALGHCLSSHLLFSCFSISFFQFQLRTKPFFSFFVLEKAPFYFSGSGFPPCHPTYCQRFFLDLNHPGHSSPLPSSSAP